MAKRMLIDATHPEETRAVVLDDHHLIDFDFETSTKRQLKGNIYLAKVTRVEPSLQAAFVDYGGNRHGFLAFSEIHPDYYQIPQADRAMLEDLEREAASKPSTSEGEAATNGNGEAAPTAETITTDPDEETAEVVAEQARRRARLLRSYKIQEVIKRRQIMLVQVVKEERGSKGAALTTYLSLAGRYCVLMPNTPRGGGISRKIVAPEDRRKLKQIAQELEVPSGMGLIIRTAGQERSKAEIKRDYEYLLRLWNEIRETTLQSIAPKLIYEEGDLIKRALRDLYTRDIEEVLVEGEEGYRSAKRLMQMLMPSRARLVKPYREEMPLFFHYRVEDQLDAMHSPVVGLPSGGSIVIHTTEALTAIDVNSGRSTRERHIDETALKTNLEAADEVARQLRLRDLAGLIVIDFIDMAEGRHQRAVEKRLRDALKADRARIQMGKISQFGLLELSRQRLRASLLELSSQICPHCAGLGVVRSTESCALQTLRAIQEEGIRHEAATLRVTLPDDVALYLLNQKREALTRLEQRYAMRVIVQVDEEMVPPAMRLEMIEKRERTEPSRPEPAEAAPPEKAAEERRPTAAAAAAAEEDEQAGVRRRRKRRRRRRRPSETEAGLPPAAAAGEAAVEPEGETGEEGEEEETAEETPPLPPRVDVEAVIQAEAGTEAPPVEAPPAMDGPAMDGEAAAATEAAPPEAAAETETAEEAKPTLRRRRTRRPRPAEEGEAAADQAEPEEIGDAVAMVAPPEPLPEPVEPPAELAALQEPPPAAEAMFQPELPNLPAGEEPAAPEEAASFAEIPAPETPVPDEIPAPTEVAVPAEVAAEEEAPTPREPEPVAAVADGEAPAAATANGADHAEPAGNAAGASMAAEEGEAQGEAGEEGEPKPLRQGWWNRWVR